MPKSSKGALSRYVRRVMEEKGLTQHDIELRSDGKITDGYVADILSGAAKNPSALKIKALATGLDVDAHGLFNIVCGPFDQLAGERAAENMSTVVLFMEMMQGVAESPELMKILQELIELLPEERAVVLGSLKRLNERKAQPGKKSLRGRERG